MAQDGPFDFMPAAAVMAQDRPFDFMPAAAVMAQDRHSVHLQIQRSGIGGDLQGRNVTEALVRLY